MPAFVSSLIVPLMRTVEALAVSQRPDRLPVPVGLWQVLATLPEPRDRRGIRHSLPSVIAVALAAVLAGARTLAAIGEWAADLPVHLRPRFGITRRPPSAATVRRVLEAVDADLFDAVLHAWLVAISPPPGPGSSEPADRQRSAMVPVAFTAVAVDGKTCRGARGLQGRRTHLFSMAEHTSGIPLGQVNAGGKDHEIAAFAAVLDRIDLHGVIITADALHTQRAHAHYLHRHHAHYLFIVKGNQPTLHDQLAALPWTQVPIGHATAQKGHGRREERNLQVIAKVGTGIAFPHARQVLRIHRTRRSGAKAEHKVLYAVTSLPDELAGPARLAALVRGHWGIENKIHWVRDVVYDEDRSQVRTGTLPRAMATLRNIAIGAIRTHNPHAAIAATVRHLGRVPADIVPLLDHSNLTASRIDQQ